MATLEIARKKKELVNKTEEYFNAIRTNIQLSGADIKVVGITSVQSNEGKSTTAASLALAMLVQVIRPFWWMQISEIQSCLVSSSQ